MQLGYTPVPKPVILPHLFLFALLTLAGCGLTFWTQPCHLDTCTFFFSPGGYKFFFTTAGFQWAHAYA